MASAADKAFGQLLEEASADSNILGLFLSGSRGKGFETPESAYDAYIIVRDESLETYQERYPFSAFTVTQRRCSGPEISTYCRFTTLVQL